MGFSQYLKNRRTSAVGTMLNSVPSSATHKCLRVKYSTVIDLGSFEEKACRFVLSLLLLAILGSVLPALWNYVGFNAILGYLLGVVYIRDTYGRYHYTWDGHYVGSEEACCLQILAVLFGIGIPAVITVWSLPFYALNELLIATFGAEFVAVFGGFGLLE